MTSSHTDKSLADKVTAMKRAHLDDGSASVALRQDRLQRAADLLANHHTELVEAISADYGHRSTYQSLLADVLASIGAGVSRRHLRSSIRSSSLDWQS